MDFEYFSKKPCNENCITNNILVFCIANILNIIKYYVIFYRYNNLNTKKFRFNLLPN